MIESQSHYISLVGHLLFAICEAKPYIYMRTELPHWYLSNYTENNVDPKWNKWVARNQASPQGIQPLTMLRKTQWGPEAQSLWLECFLMKFLPSLTFWSLTPLPLSIQFDLPLALCSCTWLMLFFTLISYILSPLSLDYLESLGLSYWVLVLLTGF